MDQLTGKQTKTGSSITHLLELIKKEPQERRTPTLIEKRTQELKQLWSEFEDCHERIIEYDQPTHTYFVNKYYDQVLKVVNQAHEVLTTYKKAHETKKIGQKESAQQTENQISSEGIQNQQKENKIRNKRLQLRLEAFARQLNEINLEVPLSMAAVQFYTRELTESFKSLQLLHEETLVFSDENDLSKDLLELLNEQKSRYDTIIALNDMENVHGNTSPEIRLPRLTIPVFDGKYESWVAFHDIFIKLIHNNNKLADVERMQYLKGNLKGEALRLISHLEIAESNYLTAWELLKGRYDNKRKMVSIQIQTLLSLPKLESESANGIKRIYDSVRECLYSIKNFGIDTTSWAPFVVHLVLQKMDPETHRLYEHSLQNPREIPSIEELNTFLESRFRSLEALTDNRRRDNTMNKTTALEKQKSSFKQGSFLRNYHSSSTNKCRYCLNSHNIYNCPAFQALDIDQRKSFISKNKLCFNCLNHEAREMCRSQRKCNICKQFHHTLLHEDKKAAANYQSAQKSRPVKQNNTAKSHFTSQDVSEAYSHLTNHRNAVLLATALIKVKSNSGSFEILRALIDPGSQSSFATETAAQLLSLPRKRVHARIGGIGGTEAGIAKHEIEFIIQPRFPSIFSLNVKALVLPNLTKLLPDTQVRQSIGWKNCVMADPTFNKPGPVDLILGADIYGNIILEGVHKNGSGLIAHETELGWIILGQTDRVQTNSICSLVTKIELGDLLKKFWEMEEVPERSKTFQEDECEDHYLRTHTRNSDGSYTVRIPFKSSKQPLGD